MIDASWTEDRVAKLTRLWADGLPASRIAGELGGVTRNSVISKVHRIKLPGRARRAVHSVNPRQPRKLNMTKAARSLAAKRGERLPPAYDALAHHAERDKKAPVGFEITWKQLARADQCRYPHGDPLHADFKFCGALVVAGQSVPYCAYHARLCYAGYSVPRPSTFAGGQ